MFIPVGFSGIIHDTRISDLCPLYVTGGMLQALSLIKKTGIREGIQV
jgi:hypothetical protein